MNRIPTATLTAGDTFIYNGEVATFIMWVGRPFDGGQAMRRTAAVRTGDNSDGVRWNLNMAGSVELV